MNTRNKVSWRGIPIPEEEFEEALKEQYGNDVVLQDMARTLFYTTKQQYVWGVCDMDDKTYDGMITFVNKHLDRYLP